MNQRRHHDETGITLVELLVVVLILGVVGAFTVTALVQGFGAAATAQERLDVIEEGHRSLARISRELRSACGAVELSPQVADVVVADRGAAGEFLRFRIERSGDDVVIQRWLVADTGSETAQGTSTVATGVLNTDLFTARTTSGAETTLVSGVYSRPDVAELEIELLLQSADADQVSVTTSVNVRNQPLALHTIGDPPC